MLRGIKWRGDGEWRLQGNGIRIEEGKIKDIKKKLALQYSDGQGALAREQRVRAGDGRLKQEQ